MSSPFRRYIYTRLEALKLSCTHLYRFCEQCILQECEDSSFFEVKWYGQQFSVGFIKSVSQVARGLGISDWEDFWA